MGRKSEPGGGPGIAGTIRVGKRTAIIYPIRPRRKPFVDFQCQRCGGGYWTAAPGQVFCDSCGFRRETLARLTRALQ